MFKHFKYMSFFDDAPPGVVAASYVAAKPAQEAKSLPAVPAGEAAAAAAAAAGTDYLLSDG